MPRALLPRAPMIPATCVPWPCLSSPDPLPSTRSPPNRSSITPLRSSSRPLDGSLVFSHRLDFRSGWLLCTPVSSTATFAQLVRLFQALGRVDVVVGLLFDRVLLADARVVGVLGDADRRVVFDAQDAVAAAQPGPEILEADPLSGADRERPDETQPQSKPAAGAADDLLPARLVGVGAELHEQAADRGRLPAGLRKPVLAESDRAGGRRHPDHQKGERSQHDQTRRHAHDTTLPCRARCCQHRGRANTTADPVRGQPTWPTVAPGGRREVTLPTLHRRPYPEASPFR